MLQNAVSPVDHLKQVKGTAQQLKVSLGQDLNYDNYEKLLKDTAIACDSKLRFQSSREARRVCEHDLEHSFYPELGDPLEIDLSISIISAHETNNGQNHLSSNSHMPKDACIKLSEEARITRNKLDDDSKSTNLSSLTFDRKMTPSRFPQKSNATSAPEFIFRSCMSF